ncbi:ankyrin repeat-containing protein At5g02620-like isoform X2 [Quercus lobata]|uniref:ankyrin repeat-containing protein At5g02620-like isoform X2 n=1 Tax=Quercus lobata TaxID=97700 RepID=UPI001246629E|nr:ankyrin repeat-containing protein At5g02620-like isoform X2 [Quercus lobata]
MEPVYYKAAAEGKIEVFKDIPKPLKQLLTPNRNTVLDIHLTTLFEKSESSTDFVEEILTKCPELLRQANVKGETPLHIAAKYGDAAIVKVLIEHAKRPQQDPKSEVKVTTESALPPELESGVDKTVKKMLKMKNKENETAMHEAVRNNHLEVVKPLVENGKDISYSANDAGETPLYMAVERNYREVVLHILENCKSLTHDGPLGGTTLHAAVIWNDDVMTGEIQEKIEPKALSAQKYNRRCLTPLHCAAYFNGYSTIKILLKIDRSMAYKKDRKDMTALHIAADRGHVKIVSEILEYCPDCNELVDKRGWNALRFAVNSSHKDVINVILNQSSLSNLLNEKDESRNTPLLHSKSLPYIKDLMQHNRVNKMAFNKQNLDAYDIEELSKEKESVNQRSATMFQRSKSCPVKLQG